MSHNFNRIESSGDFSGDARPERKGDGRLSHRSVAGETSLGQEEEGGDAARQGTPNDANDAGPWRVRHALVRSLFLSFDAHRWLEFRSTVTFPSFRFRGSPSHPGMMAGPMPVRGPGQGPRGAGAGMRGPMGRGDTYGMSTTSFITLSLSLVCPLIHKLQFKSLLFFTFFYFFKEYYFLSRLFLF